MTESVTVPPGSGLPGKPTSASRTTLSHIMTHSDTNLLGTVHGGVIMKLVDDAAGAVAGRHSEGPAVTASMDEMVFLEPVRVGDLVHVRAQVNWTGRSSMEVGVRVLAERWNKSEPPTQVGTAYLVFAAVDGDGRIRPVPPVIAENERDRRRHQEAQIRRTHRLARRRAIKELREQRSAEGMSD
ncbi:acyl-CoA thioesterase [Streptomyces sp. ACA25]|uniref:acyl-CoA thioesterase n=1 Tax=Streptomyces sp. ACA25 TaxID=3022596 RepID=UPI002308311A|nr:acyl-CoA thioesterase [Streptomyces sp. ACA25]MDB1087173.1 acyl-CoA thioesterase [Streptomyces sp. ACA25]